jgi:hypothetical protein
VVYQSFQQRFSDNNTAATEEQGAYLRDVTGLVEIIL